MVCTVVILGASYAGLTIAHKLLKHTRRDKRDLEIVLVNPSTHFYWNLASIRAIIPGALEDQAIFQDIAKNFGYATKGFEFVLGCADGVDIDKKTVSIAAASGQRIQKYDILVLATGSRTVGNVPWKAAGSYETTRNVLHETRDKVAVAKSIIIAGGGATGAELAGELGYEYGRKKRITLVCSALPLSATRENSD
jgi:NADH dehydrogenase FAD-containing subunit